MMYKCQRIITYFIIVLIALIAFPKVSEAHAYVVTSTPGENKSLDHWPTTVSVTYNEGIQHKFYSLSLVDANGEKIALDSVTLKKNDRVLQGKLTKQPKPGVYSLEWHVVSADGHSITNVIPFSVGISNADLSNVKKINEQGLSSVVVIDRGVLYIGYSVFFGVLLFLLVWFRPKEQDGLEVVYHRAQRFLRWSFIFIALATFAQLFVQTKLSAEVSWIKAFQFSLVKETLQTQTGHIFIIQFVLVVLLACAVYTGKHILRTWRMLSITVLFVALLFSKAWIGHALATTIPWVSVLMDFIHLLCAAAWVGSILAMIVLFTKATRQSDEIVSTIQRFSPWAMVMVFLLLLSGLTNSLLYVHSVDGLLHTKYGKTLIIKAALFVLMALIGAGHYLQTKRKKRPLGATLKAELLVGVIILIMAGVLANLPSPPKPIVQPILVVQQADNGDKLSFNVQTDQMNKRTYHVTFRDSKGENLHRIQQVTIKATNVSNKKEVTFRLPQKKDGAYETSNFYLNQSGYWKIEVHALTKQFTNIDANFKVNLQNN